MEKTDLRKLSNDAREALIATGIQMLKKGNTQNQVAAALGCHPRTISNWLRAYKKEGTKNLNPQTKGRQLGERRSLINAQEKALQKILIEKYPEQLKLPYALWTRKAVKELINAQYEMDMPIRTVGEYLKRWGFTPKKPIRRAYEQQPEKIKKWLKEQYPAIKAKAKRQKAEIQWCDETGFSNEDDGGRGDSSRGVSPLKNGMESHFKISMISSINNEGQTRWMVYEEAMNIDLFIKFAQRLIKDSERKVFLIVGNLRIHHAIKASQWVEKHKDKIELFFLPPL